MIWALGWCPGVYRRGAEHRRIFWDPVRDCGWWWDQNGNTATLREISGMQFFAEGWKR